MDFSLLDSDFDEKSLRFLNLSPVKLVKSIARAKLDYAVEKYAEKLEKEDIVLAADTIIFLDRKTVYGKPKNGEEARRMLSSYSARTHTVATAIAACSKTGNKRVETCSLTKLSFSRLSKEDLDFLLQGDEWQGVAGAYRIQGKASFFIKKITGSYSAVVGFPLHDFYSIAKKLKVSI